MYLISYYTYREWIKHKQAITLLKYYEILPFEKEICV